MDKSDWEYKLNSKVCCTIWQIKLAQEGSIDVEVEICMMTVNLV